MGGPVAPAANGRFEARLAEYRRQRPAKTVLTLDVGRRELPDSQTGLSRKGCLPSHQSPQVPLWNRHRAYSSSSMGPGTSEPRALRAPPADDESAPPGSRPAGQQPGESILGSAVEQLGLLLLRHDVDQVVVVQAHLRSSSVSSRDGGVALVNCLSQERARHPCRPRN